MHATKISFLNKHINPTIGLKIFNLIKNTPFKLTNFIVPTNQETPVDKHSEPEYWIIVKGSGILTKDKTSCNVNEGDVIFFPPYIQHQISNNSDSDLIIYSIYW